MRDTHGHPDHCHHPSRQNCRQVSYSSFLLSVPAHLKSLLVFCSGAVCVQFECVCSCFTDSGLKLVLTCKQHGLLRLFLPGPSGWVLSSSSHRRQFLRWRFLPCSNPIHRLNYSKVTDGWQRLVNPHVNITFLFPFQSSWAEKESTLKRSEKVGCFFTRT